jgi:Tfp pilus assembly protein PilN
MRAVNLLPKTERRPKTRAEQAPVFAGAGMLGLVAVVLAAGFLWANAGAQEQQSQLDNLQAQLDLLGPLPKPRSAVETGLADQERARVGALTSALSRRVSWDRVLRELSLVLPDDIWLTSLVARSPSSPASAAPAPPTAPGAPPSGFTITGYTYSHESVARLLARLGVVPDLRNVQLQRSTMSKIGRQEIVQFVILADVLPPGASA